jgi:hypothetical protein
MPRISNDDLQKCTEREFKLCNKDMLKGFILARVYQNVPKQIASDKVPTRKQQRVDVALELKGIQIILNVLSQEVLSTVSDSRQANEQIPEIINPHLGHKPKYYLNNKP